MNILFAVIQAMLVNGVNEVKFAVNLQSLGPKIHRPVEACGWAKYTDTRMGLVLAPPQAGSSKINSVGGLRAQARVWA